MDKKVRRTENYSPDLVRYTPEHVRFNMDLINIVKSDNTILDVGCGDGIWTNELSKYYKSATGIDINSDGINIAKQRYPHINFELSCLYEYNQKHDTVFTRGCGLHENDILHPGFQRSIEKMVSLCDKEFIYMEYSKYPNLDPEYWSYKNPKEAELYLSQFGKVVHSVFKRHYLCIKISLL
jgi:SAM-dependent methyltransferase